jgi:hypothetical protein
MGVEENETDDGQALVYRTPLFAYSLKLMALSTFFHACLFVEF